MRRHWALLLAALLVCAALGGALAQDDIGGDVEDAEEPVVEERAFLIARKFLGGDQEHMVNGEPATIVVELHNAGDRCDMAQNGRASAHLVVSASCWCICSACSARIAGAG